MLMEAPLRALELNTYSVNWPGTQKSRDHVTLTVAIYRRVTIGMRYCVWTSLTP